MKKITNDAEEERRSLEGEIISRQSQNKGVKWSKYLGDELLDQARHSIECHSISSAAGLAERRACNLRAAHFLFFFIIFYLKLALRRPSRPLPLKRTLSFRKLLRTFATGPLTPQDSHTCRWLQCNWCCLTNIQGHASRLKCSWSAGIKTYNISVNLTRSVDFKIISQSCITCNSSHPAPKMACRMRVRYPRFFGHSKIFGPVCERSPGCSYINRGPSPSNCMKKCHHEEPTESFFTRSFFTTHCQRWSSDITHYDRTSLHSEQRNS